MKLTRLLIPASIASIALLWAATVATKPAVVACVDIEKVFRSLDQLKAAEIKNTALRTELQVRVDAITDEVRAMQEELESFQPGSDAHKAAMNKAVLKAGDLSALQTFSDLKLESERANTVRDAYIKVRESCAVVSKESGIDVVFVDDAIPPINPSNLEGMMQQISGRRMLYASSNLDLTDLLIERMNRDFRAANPGYTAPPADTTTPSAPTPTKS